MICTMSNFCDYCGDCLDCDSDHYCLACNKCDWNCNKECEDESK